MSQTKFGNVSVYAHLGGFIQPNTLLIHIPGSDSINSDNLADFLTAMARSTPSAPLGGTFSRVSLTCGWTGSYMFSGEDWKRLGDMVNESETTRRNFIVENVESAGSDKILDLHPDWTEEYKQQKRNAAWATFISRLTKP